MAYTLKLHPDIEKRLSRIPEKQRERLVETMRSLSVEPRPHGCQHLQDELYRIREGQYRIIYAIFENEVVIVVCKVTRRTEKTYKDLEGLLDRAIRELLK
jgi:mRNA interferase RelE/StbE